MSVLVANVAACAHRLLPRVALRAALCVHTPCTPCTSRFPRYRRFCLLVAGCCLALACFRFAPPWPCFVRRGCSGGAVLLARHRAALIKALLWGARVHVCIALTSGWCRAQPEVSAMCIVLTVLTVIVRASSFRVVFEALVVLGATSR